MQTKTPDPQARIVTCRRCGTPYALGPRAILPACPKCGASPTRRLKFRDNRVAAVLALIAAACLGFSLCLPFMKSDMMGEIRRYSLVGGVIHLWRAGHHLISAILFAFSLIFPFAKLAAILVATSRLVRLTPAHRRLLHKFADVTGKYSLLDVIVLGIVIVLVQFKGKVTITAESGVFWFAVGVVLSIAAGMAVTIPEKSSE